MKDRMNSEQDKKFSEEIDEQIRFVEAAIDPDMRLRFQNRTGILLSEPVLEAFKQIHSKLQKLVELKDKINNTQDLELKKRALNAGFVALRMIVKEIEEFYKLGDLVKSVLSDSNPPNAASALLQGKDKKQAEKLTDAIIRHLPRHSDTDYFFKDLGRGTQENFDKIVANRDPEILIAILHLHNMFNTYVENNLSQRNESRHPSELSQAVINIIDSNDPNLPILISTICQSEELNSLGLCVALCAIKVDVKANSSLDTTRKTIQENLTHLLVDEKNMNNRQAYATILAAIISPQNLTVIAENHRYKEVAELEKALLENLQSNKIDVITTNLVNATKGNAINLAQIKNIVDDMNRKIKETPNEKDKNALKAFLPKMLEIALLPNLTPQKKINQIKLSANDHFNKDSPLVKFIAKILIKLSNTLGTNQSILFAKKGQIEAQEIAKGRIPLIRSNQNHKH